MGSEANLTVDLHDLVLAFSEALGLVGGRVINHGKRVTYLALSLAREINLSPEEFDDLRTAALLHDAGVSRTKTYEKLTQMDWEGAMEHCRDGANLVQGFPPLARVAQIILMHHTKWVELLRMDVNPRIALLANLIFLADRIDVQINWNSEILLSRERIVGQIDRMPGFFNPEVLAIFKRKALIEVFWLSLYPRHLAEALARFQPRTKIFLDLADVRRMAALFATIVDNKSQYTRHHSEGVARLCRFLAQSQHMDGPTVDKLHIAGLMHDLGKLAVPDDILEKPAALSPDEFQIIKRHPYETYYLLSRIPGLCDIRDWAAFHHEKSDGSGYPFHIGQDSLGLAHVVVMLSDMIQALIQDRPYRAGLKKEQVLDILEYLAVHQPVFAPMMIVVREDYDRVAAVAKGEEEP